MLFWKPVTFARAGRGHPAMVRLKLRGPWGSLLLELEDQTPGKLSKRLHLDCVLFGSCTARLSHRVSGRYSLHDNAIAKHPEGVSPVAFGAWIPTCDLRIPFHTLQVKRQSGGLGRLKKGRIRARRQSLSRRLKCERERR